MRHRACHTVAVPRRSEVRKLLWDNNIAPDLGGRDIRLRNVVALNAARGHLPSSLLSLMSRPSTRLAAVLAAVLAVAAPAGAQLSFAGSSTGCFTTGSNCTAAANAATGFGGLSFAGRTNASFGTATAGTLNGIALGSFTLTPEFDNGYGFAVAGLNAYTFKLRLNFTQPVGSSTQSYFADLDAGLIGGQGLGDVLVSFGSPSQYQHVTFTGGSFDLRVDNVTLNGIGGASTRTLYGDIKNASFGSVGVAAVPEPTTYALFGAGLLGVAGVARRRRAA